MFETFFRTQYVVNSNSNGFDSANVTAIQMALILLVDIL